MWSIACIKTSWLKGHQAIKTLRELFYWYVLTVAAVVQAGHTIWLKSKKALGDEPKQRLQQTLTKQLSLILFMVPLNTNKNSYNNLTSFLAVSTYSSTLWRCSSEIRAPIWVSGLIGSPTLMFLVRSTTLLRNSSKMLFSTNTLVPLEHTCYEQGKKPSVLEHLIHNESFSLE